MARHSATSCLSAKTSTWPTVRQIRMSQHIQLPHFFHASLSPNSGRSKTMHRCLTVIFETDYEMRVLQEKHNSSSLLKAPRTLPSVSYKLRKIRWAILRRYSTGDYCECSEGNVRSSPPRILLCSSEPCVDDVDLRRLYLAKSTSDRGLGEVVSSSASSSIT